MKTCIKCHKNKSMSQFYLHKSMSDGHLNECKDCVKARVSKRAIDKKDYIVKYDKWRQRFSIKRILNHRYASMKTRVEGRGMHSYSCVGKEMMTMEEFLEWNSNETVKTQFTKLYNNWKKCGFKRKLAPSIDRVDNSKGYTKDNIQWMTQSQNSSKYTK